MLKAKRGFELGSIMIDEAETKRARVLLVAFACSPDHGSEWAVGWNRAIECAKHFDAWVICQGDQQELEIRRFLEAHGPIPGLHFEFVSYKAGGRHPHHPHRLEWLTYNWWHRKAFRAARRLHEALHFDLVHQVTSTGYREPGYLWKLDVPFVWGPVGGAHNFPWRFLSEAGRYAPLEALRNATNSFQLNWSRRGQRATRRAKALLVANSTVQKQFHRARGALGELLLETGIARVAESSRQRAAHSGPLRILWSGQFIPRKALQLLLKSLAKLSRDVSYELRVLGAGPMERRWKRLADRLGIGPHIQWLGWVPYKQALALYDWADAFVFTSLRDTSGNVVLEALANGVPVVCLDHQGVRDIVTDACGFKVAVDSPQQVVDDLAAVLTRLARDRGLAENMREAAIERARDYLWSAQGAKMTEIYRLVIGQNDGAAPPQTACTRPANGSTTDAYRNGGSVPATLDDDYYPAVIPRDRLREVATWVAERAAVGLHKLGGDRLDEGFGILMYHRVAERTSGVESPTNNVTPQRLRMQLEGLLARGFEARPLGQVLEAYGENRLVPANTFVVTFDDGYENNFHRALPILRELRIPATIFLATAFLDSARPFPCDDWSCAGSPRVPISSWRPLSTAQCHEMLASGLIELGAHTHTHQFFLGRVDGFRRDLARCIEVLEERFGITRPSFAFPFGMLSPELIEVARELGVACALSTRSERVRADSAPFTWGRFSADDSDTVAALAAKLNGWYTTVAGVLRVLKRRVAAFAPHSDGIVDTPGATRADSASLRHRQSALAPGLQHALGQRD